MLFMLAGLVEPVVRLVSWRYFYFMYMYMYLLDAAYGRKHVTTYKLPVSDDAARALYPKLKLEYKFYNFVKARFRRLYAALKQAQDKYPTT